MRFFQTYAVWQWPLPVILVDTYDDPYPRANMDNPSNPNNPNNPNNATNGIAVNDGDGDTGAGTKEEKEKEKGKEKEKESESGPKEGPKTKKKFSLQDERVQRQLQQHPMWNPLIYYKDKAQRMPILTPAFPAMNSAYNVADPQFRAINQEIARACLILQDYINDPKSSKSSKGANANTNISNGKANSSSSASAKYTPNKIRRGRSDPVDSVESVESVGDRADSIYLSPAGQESLGGNVNLTFAPFAALFEPSVGAFFNKYGKYVRIDIAAANEEHKRAWFGWVESRLRLLILGLEQPPHVLVHPTANCFHRLPVEPASPASVSVAGNHSRGSKMGDTETIEIEVETGDGGETGETAEGVSISTGGYSNAALCTPPKPKGKEEIRAAESVQGPATSTFFMGLTLNGPFPSEQGQGNNNTNSKVNLSFAINDFKMKCQCWAGWKQGMTLHVTVVDASQLPTWVFDTKAEPSNIRACTPAKTPRYGARNGPDSHLKGMSTGQTPLSFNGGPDLVTGELGLDKDQLFARGKGVTRRKVTGKGLVPSVSVTSPSPYESKADSYSTSGGVTVIGTPGRANPDTASSASASSPVGSRHAPNRAAHADAEREITSPIGKNNGTSTSTSTTPTFAEKLRGSTGSDVRTTITSPITNNNNNGNTQEEQVMYFGSEEGDGEGYGGRRSLTPPKNLFPDTTAVSGSGTMSESTSESDESDFTANSNSGDSININTNELSLNDAVIGVAISHDSAGLSLESLHLQHSPISTPGVVRGARSASVDSPDHTLSPSARMNMNRGSLEPYKRPPVLEHTKSPLSYPNPHPAQPLLLSNAGRRRFSSLDSTDLVHLPSGSSAVGADCANAKDVGAGGGSRAAATSSREVLSLEGETEKKAEQGGGGGGGGSGEGSKANGNSNGNGNGTQKTKKNQKDKDKDKDKGNPPKALAGGSTWASRLLTK